jgi:hypothetical protein
LLTGSSVNTRVSLWLPITLAACASSTFHVIRLVDGPKKEQSPLGALEVVNVSTSVREPFVVHGCATR